MLSINPLHKLEEFLKNNRRSTEFLGAALGIIISAVLGTGLLLYSAHLDRQVEIRKHNLDVFYKSLTCDDLPIESDSSVEKCQQAIGKFMWREENLFTR